MPMGGATVSGMTQEERSKSMNSSAFSCGERSVSAQLAGGAVLVVSFVEVSPATWRSLNTARPQYAGAPPSALAIAFTGVSKEKYIVCPDMPVPSDVIQACDALSVVPTTEL